MILGDENLKGKIDVHISEEDNVVPHMHLFLELVYVLEGEAVHMLNRAETVVRAGDYFIIDYNSAHGYRHYGKGGFKIVNCLFKSEFIDETLKRCNKFSEVVSSYMIKHSYTTAAVNPANNVYHDSDGSILQLVTGLAAEQNAAQIGYLEVMRCDLIKIILKTIRKMNEQAEVAYSSVVEYICAYANQNYPDKTLLGTLSRKLNFSLAYLSSRFKAETGITFTDYIKRIRVEQSCRLMENSDKKIIDIAASVGYSDIKFFNRVFKQHMGITPSEYRRSI